MPEPTNETTLRERLLDARSTLSGVSSAIRQSLRSSQGRCIHPDPMAGNNENDCTLGTCWHKAAARALIAIDVELNKAVP